jgi:hypothetical protein
MDGMWLRRLRYFVRQRQADDDLLTELEFHREMKQRELEAAGLRSTDASNAAKVAMGNMLLAREDARAVWTTTNAEPAELAEFF